MKNQSQTLNILIQSENMYTQKRKTQTTQHKDDRTKTNTFKSVKTNGKMMGLNLTISIITLNVHNTNTHLKKWRLSHWIKKQDPSICCLQETHFKYKDKTD